MFWRQDILGATTLSVVMELEIAWQVITGFSL